MYPPRFSYEAPTTIEEAIELLGRGDGETKILAGGQSLIPMMKLRFASPATLIDINNIPGLGYLFRTTTQETAETELVILLQPRILTPAWENEDVWRGLDRIVRARVRNTAGDVIPGLYAAGETVGLYYRVYPGATSVLRGAVTGRFAGRDAAMRRNA